MRIVVKVDVAAIVRELMPLVLLLVAHS